VQRSAEREIETPWGKFHMVSYRDLAVGALHLALTLGKIEKKSETLVRVHEPLSILDLLDAEKNTHSWGVGEALKEIQKSGAGVMVLMNCAQDEAAAPKAGRGNDLRLYGIGAQILRDVGVGRMRLMAAPRKMPSMAGFGLEITGYAERPGS
jgi:3,4-dihydroxy 2-butanone 4-phosphate synthase/GTP cyclohydrolase II